MNLSIASHGILKIAGFLTGLAILFSVLVLPPPSTGAQSTKELCSGANLDLGNTKHSCVSSDGNPAGASNICKDAAGATIPCSDSALNNLIAQILNVFSIIVGVLAVIMIIYGGARYVTSGGDSGKVGESKNTIIFALIGLVIVALAQFIVKFVLNRVAAA